MSEVSIVYKLLVLELLNKSTISLSNSQICEFFVHYGYSDYFRIQSILSELVDSELIESTKTHNVTLYHITNLGETTLVSLYDHITPGMKDDIKAFFEKNQIDMENNNNIIADFFAAAHGGYFTHLSVIRDNLTIMDLHLHVDSEEMARTLTTNWRRDYEKVYASIMDILI